MGGLALCRHVLVNRGGRGGGGGGGGDLPLLQHAQAPCNELVLALCLVQHLHPRERA